MTTISEINGVCNLRANNSGRLVRSLPICGNGHIIMTMKKRTIPAGQFKAECLRLIDQVADTREPLIVTKRGRPVVEVVPIRIRESNSLRGSVTVHGDIVGPILDSWDVDR